MREIEKEKIIEIVKEAGHKVEEIYKEKYKVYTKTDNSPVTEADMASNEIILKGLAKYDLPIFSEEANNGWQGLGKEKYWIIDPLDGTQDFLQKTGEFSIMIGLVEKGEPVLGTIYLPVKDKLYWAEKDSGAFLNNSKINVSEVSKLENSRFVTSRFHLDKKTEDFLKDSGVESIKCGSIGVKIGLIAEGEAEGYLTFSDRTCQWDTCAPEIVLREAGGGMTNLEGERLRYNKEINNPKGIIATNKLIHKKML